MGNIREKALYVRISFGSGRRLSKKEQLAHVIFAVRDGTDEEIAAEIIDFMKSVSPDISAGLEEYE